jgi:long-chain acyl-CoA synthetase
LPTKNKMNLDKFKNLIELYLSQAKKQKPKSDFLEWLNPKNKVKFTWEETSSNIYKIANTIKENIKDGDRCLLVSENRPEWLISDIAIMLANGVTVPAYTTYTEQDYKYLIEDCKPSVIIISNNIIHDKLKKIIDENIFVKKVITFDEIKNVNYKNKYINFNHIIKKKLNDSDKIQNLDLKRNSPACIIYTSGTGGNPKGVILSHGGILNNLEGACEILKPLNDKNPVFLTWLPLSHSYEHTVQFVQIAVGAKVFYAEKIEKLLENMSVAKPTIMTAVPRFYQNLYNKINFNMKKTKGLKAQLIKLTIDLGKKNLLKEKMSFLEIVLNSIVNLVIRKKIKKQFGGNLKAFVSGGGALDKEIGQFLNAIGLPTLQGYGLTEASPVVSCNPINKIRVETVGPPFRGNQVKIAQDGEILVKGENVMLGYWNKKEETEKVLKDGWLYTGDIGEIDPKDGYLKITDRKKDIIVTAGGDNISPAKIENQLLNSTEIEQVMVYGDEKSYLVALIVPSIEFRQKKEKISEIVNKINKNLTLIEKIKKFRLIEENFTIENGLLTPTMKVKRNKVIIKYKNLLENFYKIG